MAIERFDQLRVYQRAFYAAMTIFEQSKRWPQEERYALTDQIRRSSRSVCTHVAEAWHQRRHERHFIGKLGDADAAAAETRVWLQFAARCGYLDPAELERLGQIYHAVCGDLSDMMAAPQKWCTPADTVREDHPAYQIGVKHLSPALPVSSPASSQ